ncbi:MAG TPA: sterol desaturase family protein [Rhizomicrobium sp.]|nr:sterol desaturase family protein [Rhizomicrobium sp.]
MTALPAIAAVLWGLLPASLVVWAGHMLVFHGIGFGFELCDRTGALKRFRVRRHERLTYAAALPRVLFNQTFVLLPAMWLCEKTGLAFVGSQKISLAFAAISLVLLTMGHDIVQYTAHRGLLHNLRFRWLRHDLHHSTGASRAITACYMSVPDFFLTIVCPYLIPLVLIGGGTANVPFQLLVACLGAVGGLYEHSGYDFAIGFRTATRRWLSQVPASLVSSHAHGEHHRRSRVSFSDGFGSPGLCDLIFRTRWDLR